MTAGMAGIIAAHSWFAVDDDGMMVCWFNDCGWRHARGGETFALHAAHVAEELTKAGYGNVQEAQAAAWENGKLSYFETTLTGQPICANPYLPDPLAAALADEEGHALVKAIHDRKATIPAEQDWNF